MGLLTCLPMQNIVHEYLDGVVNTIIVKDIATFARDSGHRYASQSDVFLASNIGQQLTASKIAHYPPAWAESHPRYQTTILVYLRRLSFSRNVAGRYDIKGEGTHETNHKFYIVDLGLRNALLVPCLRIMVPPWKMWCIWN